MEQLNIERNFGSRFSNNCEGDGPNLVRRTSNKRVIKPPARFALPNDAPSTDCNPNVRKKTKPNTPPIQINDNDEWIVKNIKGMTQGEAFFCFIVEWENPCDGIIVTENEPLHSLFMQTPKMVYDFLLKHQPPTTYIPNGRPNSRITSMCINNDKQTIFFTCENRKSRVTGKTMCLFSPKLVLQFLSKPYGLYNTSGSDQTFKPIQDIEAEIDANTYDDSLDDNLGGGKSHEQNDDILVENRHSGLRFNHNYSLFV